MIENTIPQELKQALKNKHILLDTVVLSNLYHHPEPLRPVWSLFNEVHCEPTYFPLIELEFLRGTKPKVTKKKREFIKEVASSIPRRNDLVDEALELAEIYCLESHASISLVDCLIGTYLKGYGEELFLLTVNYSDFPTTVFDRMFIYPIEIKGKIEPLVFIKYNEKKWQNICSKYKNDLRHSSK